MGCIILETSGASKLESFLDVPPFHKVGPAHSGPNGAGTSTEGKTHTRPHSDALPWASSPGAGYDVFCALRLLWVQVGVGGADELLPIAAGVVQRYAAEADEVRINIMALAPAQ